MSTSTLLAAVLEAEHAAVYGYGVLGARLDVATRAIALAAFDAHRARRDDLLARLGTGAPATGAAYDVSVHSPAEALVLAVSLEVGVGMRWLDLVGGTSDPALRLLGVSGLQETAVRAANWRRLRGAGPVTVAFPGRR